jgi:SAM-dependent methyltransferase
MKILIIGHGKNLPKIHSLSADKDYYEKLIKDDKNTIVTLDIDARSEPDVIFDFRENNYPFDDKTFDIIIDASGLGLIRSYLRREFWDEMNRILKLHGFFLGRRRSLFYNSSFSASPSLLSDNDSTSDEVALINRYGFYEKHHQSNMNHSYLSLEKVHKPRYE